MTADLKHQGALFTRRDVVRLLATTGSMAFIGCDRFYVGEPSGPYSRQTIGGCLVTPEMTEGPFFVDEKLNRQDIRVDPANGALSEGVPLRVVLQVNQIANNSCAPLTGATVDLWHCDTLGSYSDVQDNAGGSGDTRGRKFLRGYQLTNSEGKVEFQTIYPGWYEGRAVHVHYKIRTNPTSEVGYEFTSQLFFNETVTDQVHSQPTYSRKGRRDTLNNTDGIYSRGGNDLMLQMNKDAEGYTGFYKVGFLMS